MLDDAQHWRDRAAEARFMARAMTDENSKQALLQVAAAYDRLAELAEARKPAKDWIPQLIVS
jgi:hypothetical protein